MALTVAEILNLGAGRAEYAFHVGGLTWLVHTPGLDWSALTLAQKKIICGTETYGANAFASLVDTYPYLERPGSCTVSLKEGQGVLSGGDWSAKILSDLADVTNNTLNSRSGIQGLEGLDAIANVAHDHDIGWGELSESFGKADTTLNVKNDVGDTLFDGITAAVGASKPYLLWIGAEAVASNNVAVDGDEIDITIPVGYRGLFKSKKQSHYLDFMSTPVYVADSPLYGISGYGRPGDLWMFAVDSAGTPIDDPVLIRTGKIEKQPSKSGKFWSVPVLPWWSWLDYDMDLTDKAAQLDRYQFSVAPATTAHPPHMQIKESTDGGSSWSANWTDVNLCAANAQVKYDTWEDFIDGVRDAMTAVSPNNFNYQIGPKGPYAPNALNMVRFRGPIPAICYWGDSGSASNWTDCHEAVNNYSVTPDPWDHPWWDYYADEMSVQSSSMGYTPVSYIYQMHRNSDTDYDSESISGFMQTWPPTAVSGTCSLWVKDPGDIAGMASGDVIEVGTDEFIMTGPFTARSTLAKTTVNTVSGSEIRINVAAADEYYDMETLIGKQADADPTAAKFTEGMYLYYRPTKMDPDPWPVRFDNDGWGINLSSLFKAALGDTSEITLSERIVADHVPMGYDVGDWTSFIDWDTLDAFAADVQIDNLLFMFRFSGKINLWKELQNCCRFIGVDPTFEWSADDSHYVIRFRQVGTVNATVAQLSGRVLTNDYLLDGTEPKVNISQAPLINAAELAMNYDSVEQSWGREQPVVGYGPSISGGKTVSSSIKPRFIRLNDVSNDYLWGQTLAHVAALLNRTMTPTPSMSISATVKDKFAHGVGLEALVTLENTRFPFDGTKGLDEHPGLITSMTVDLDNCTVGYTYRVAPGVNYGWGPACVITNSVVDDADTISVTGVSKGGTGRDYTNVSPLFGWYDWWPLGNIKFNQTMSAAEQITGLSDKQVIVIELGTKTPTVITGLTATNVDEGTYAAINGVSDFFELEGAHVGYTGGAKEWVCIFAPRDTASLTAAQEFWVYIADSVLQLQDSAGTPYVGNFWL